MPGVEVPQRIGDVASPNLSPQLKSIVARSAQDVSAVVERMLADMWATIPDYAALSDPATIDDVRNSVTLNIRQWYSALLAGGPLPEDQLARAASFAQRRIQQGISLQGLMRAYRIGPVALWTRLLEDVGEASELYPEMLAVVSPHLHYHFDVVAQRVYQAYTAEQFRRELWRERLRHELCGVIFAHPEDHETFNRCAQELGIDGHAPHTAIALQPDESLALTSDLDDSIGQYIEEVCRTLGEERERTLQTVRNGRILLWLAAPRGESLLSHEPRLAKAARQLAGDGLRIAAVGIGLPCSGPRGWQSSAEQAFRALHIGSRVTNGRVHRYSEIVLEDVVMKLEPALRFFEAIIEQLSREPSLLETLSAYFDVGQHRKAAAGRLDVHPNTLNYRLNRIEALLGADLADIEWQSKLHLALRLRQMSLPKEKGAAQPRESLVTGSR